MRRVELRPLLSLTEPAEMKDDAALLQRYAVDGSEAAFVELVRRHTDLVYSAAVRRCYGDTHRAQEVVQQVFVSLAQHAEKLSRHPALSAWLYTATRNAATGMWISEQRRLRRENVAATVNNTQVDPGGADWTEIRPVLDAAMDELTPADRSAVLLRFFEHRSFAEVGTVLGLSENTARVRTARAIEKLRILLGRRGVKSTAAVLGTTLAEQAVTAAPQELCHAVVRAALGRLPTTVPVSGNAALPHGLYKAVVLAVGVVSFSVAIWMVVHGARARMSNPSTLEHQLVSAVPESAEIENRAATGHSTPSGSAEAALTRSAVRSLEARGMTADQIMQAMAAAYATLSSYRDAGTVVRNSTSGRRPSTIVFQTHFRRPSAFRFDWAWLSGLKPLGPATLWWTDETAHMLLNGKKDPSAPLIRSQALRVLMTLSEGAGYHVPDLLLDERRTGQFSLLNLRRVELVGKESVMEVTCYHLKGVHPNGSNYGVWVGTKDFLIRKIETVSPLSSSNQPSGPRSASTSPDSYVELHGDIVVNTEIEAALFHANPFPPRVDLTPGTSPD